MATVFIRLFFSILVLAVGILVEYSLLEDDWKSKKLQRIMCILFGFLFGSLLGIIWSI